MLGINPFKIAASMIGTKSTSVMDFSSDQITMDSVTYTRVSSNGCNASEPGSGGAGSVISVLVVIVIVIVIIAVIVVVLYFSLSKRTIRKIKRSMK